MVLSPQAIRMHLDATPEAVAAARARAGRTARDAGMTADAVDRVRLAVSEAVTNAVLHAYPRGAGCVEVRLDADRGTLCVEVRDTGCGRAGADPATASAGYGLALMRALCDTLEVDDTPPGTRLVLRFGHGGPPATAGPDGQ